VSVAAPLAEALEPLRSEPSRAAVLLVPNVVYIAYYATVTLWLGLGNKRLPHAVPECLRAPIAHDDSSGACAIWFLSARSSLPSYITFRRAPTAAPRTPA